MTKRRDFIRKSLLGSAGIAIGGMGMSAVSYRAISGANNRISIASIGLGGRGGAHISSWCALQEKGEVRLKTICDADELRIAEKAKTVEQKTGNKPVTGWDMRRVFDDKEIECVSFATPNHWHALGTIWACQAGKHVYVEKPACHNVYEGSKMVEAAGKYRVRVQVGSQNRSIINIMEAMKFIQDGAIGDVFMARGLCYKPRDSFGIARDSDPPSTLHYDIWLGPAAWRPYNEKRGHYNWHWFWETGNGDTGNQGVNELEILRWGLGKKELPVSVYSTGGIYGIDPAECEQETPNTQTCIFRYNDGKIMEFETRGRYTNSESSLDIRIGHFFYGTEGYVELAAGTGQWKAFRKREKEPFRVSGDDVSKQSGSGEVGHFANFIDAVRAGRNDILHCDINEGFYSSALPALANISYRLGREIKLMNKNLKCINDPEADSMLTRKVYRKPYVLPEII
jgi:predicted dehydrogenase